MASCLAIFVVALAGSLLTTRWIRDWARRRGLVDMPDLERKLHARPVPRIGGVAIYLSIFAALTLGIFLPTVLGEQMRVHAGKIATIVGLGGIMMLVGLWDDLKDLKPWAKFAAQIALAMVCWMLGMRILGGWTGYGGVVHLGILSLPLTVLWMVLITNSFNLIDGVDGLSAGAALLATGSMLVVSLVNNQPTSAALLAALAGATLGFLRHNFNPASIFLGDSGSLLLGFMLALVSLESSQKSSAAFSIALPVVAFGLPVLDTTLVIIRRFLNGKPLFKGDRRHIHHVLIDRGIKPRLVVTVLYGVCGLFGLFSLLFMNPSGRTLGFALAILGVCIWFGIQQMAYPELRELNGYLARGIQHQRRLITGNVLVGRMLDGFREARKLSDVLDSLAELLHEMDFTRAEVRLPSLHQNKVVLRTRSWSALCEGRTHCLYRWQKAGEKRVRPRRGAAKPEDSDTSGIGRDFRLEFVFHVKLPETKAAPSPKPPTAPPKGIDIGRLTFFHPAGTEYPLSALCLLGRNVWREFGDAITRIMALPNAGLADRPTRASAPLDAPVEPEREVEVWTGHPARTGS